MKAFEFSLDRVRNYKNQVLDKEKKTLSMLLKKRDEILAKIEQLGKYREEKSAELWEKQQKGAMMSELSAYSFLIENARLQIQALMLELHKAEEQAEVQRQIVLTIYQEKTGMDKLEEKQAEEFRLFAAKSAENEIMQVILNSMAGKRQTSEAKPEIA